MNPSSEIVIERETEISDEARSLIIDLDEHLSARYPSESRHGLSLDQLIDPAVIFFVARLEGKAAGCGAVKLFADDSYAEVKRMYVRPEFRGRGVAKAVLDKLETTAREAGYSILRLETGIHQSQAISLYQNVGFHERGPFGSYKPDPLSRFFEKRV